VLIDNKLNKTVGIPIQKAPAIAGEAVPYLRMRPGINRVSEADLTAAKAADPFYFKKQQIEIITAAKGKDNFSAVSVDDPEELERLVARVADPELLKDMLEQDNRKEFRKLANAQLKKLELPPSNASA
jgi:hypothetical protein